MMNDGMKKKEKPPKPRYNMWQCSGYMLGLAWREKEKKVVVLCVISALLAVASNLVNLYVSPAILAVVEQKASFSELIVTVLMFTALIMLCSAASAYVETNTLYGRITVRLVLINLINRKLCTTSYSNIEDDGLIKLRDKSQEVVGNNRGASEAVWGTLSSLLTNVIGFLIYIVLLASLEWWIILVVLLTSLIGYLVNKQLSGYGYRHREEEAEICGRIWYSIDKAKDYEFAKDIRIFGLRPWFEEIYEKAMAAYRAFHRRAGNRYIWANVLDLVLSLARSGIAYAYLITLVVSGRLSVAEFLLLFSAVGGFTSWVSGILGNMVTLYRQSLDLSTIRELINYPEPFKFEDGAPVPPFEPGKYEIRLENVSFKYPSADNYTLENINLTLHPGEKIAIVGLNGAGKTTLVKLICGFYDPTEGRVLLDGRDIREFNRREYAAKFSAVFQEFSLLAGSVAVNVAQKEEGIDLDRVKSCIEKAGLTQKIESLSEKYDTKLNKQIYEEGVELSGGEMQRLMLARALYKDAPLLLLDEPTAALDPIAEADMYAKYNAMTAGRSAIYISHRLASTRFCDRILLIDNHRIVEEGSHLELLQRGGKYAALFEVQSKYYREDSVDEK